MNTKKLISCFALAATLPFAAFADSGPTTSQSNIVSEQDAKAQRAALQSQQAPIQGQVAVAIDPIDVATAHVVRNLEGDTGFMRASGPTTRGTNIISAGEANRRARDAQARVAAQ